ncbi:MAG: hypothetical protein COC24_002175 [Alphaproteobacteria bacterium]|nr:hypothetical protein [Alphaproteobacteria bacterium]
MGALVEEVRIWNTPIVGAYLLWSFTDGYMTNHRSGDAPIGLLHFIAMAILTDIKMIESIRDGKGGLQSFARGFENKKKYDRLLSIHERVQSKKEYTLSSIDVAISQGLLSWDSQTGKIYAHDLTKPTRGNAVRPSIKKYGAKAHILGKWFSQNDISTISLYLKVNL